MADHLVRGSIEALSLDFVAAVTTDLSVHAAGVHGCLSTAAVALSRGLTCGLLAAAESHKGSDRLNLQFLGKGPLGPMLIDADSEGNVRGYVRNPSVNLKVGRPSPINGEDTMRGTTMRISVASAVGQQGVINVVREGRDGKNYQGTCALESGEIDRDLVHYLLTSEQLGAVACASDALLSPSGEIFLSAGVLVTTAPGAEHELINALDAKLSDGALVPLMASRGGEGRLSARELVSALFPEHRLDVYDDRVVQFRCRCGRARAEAAILTMGIEEIDALCKTGETVKVSCDFCNTDYNFTTTDLQLLLARAREAESAHPA